jgi:hypothetical protein
MVGNPSRGEALLRAKTRCSYHASEKRFAEIDCVAGVVGFELRCAERKFISLRCRVSSDSGAPAETAAVPRENDLLRWAGPFPHRRRRLAHIANRGPSGRPASHQSSNPLTQAGRIRTSMGREWIQRLQAAPRCNARGAQTSQKIVQRNWDHRVPPRQEIATLAARQTAVAASPTLRSSACSRYRAMRYGGTGSPSLDALFPRA